MGRTRLALGDVFLVPLDDARVGAGMVVGQYLKDGYYFALFAGSHDRGTNLAPENLVRDDLAFLALSLDAKLAAGHWVVVGRVNVPADLPMPAYQEVVGTPDRVDVVDFSGTRRRPATSAELKLLPRRKVVAPVRMEKALKALHGLEPWSDVYDELRPDVARTTQRFFG